MDQRLKAFLPIILLGLAAGFIASRIVPGSDGLLKYLISGVLGAVIGGYLLSALRIDLGIRNPLLCQLDRKSVV